MWHKWVFPAVMILLAATLGCVAWWLLQQDQQLATQRIGERQDAAADLAVAALEKRFSGVEQELSRMIAEKGAKTVAPSTGAVLVQITPGLIRSWPDNGLVYYPIVLETPEAPDTLFEAADDLEFQKRDYAGAIAALGELTSSRDPKIRAAALARKARNYRKAGRALESLKANQQLAELGPAVVGAMPAALAGRLGALYVFEQQKDPSGLVSAARSLEQELNSGQWQISPATYSSLTKEVRRFAADTETDGKRRAALAESVEWLWDRWAHDRGALASGRQTLILTSGPVLLMWKTSGNATAGFAAGADYLESEWLAELKPHLDNLHAQLVLTDLEGRSVLGKSPSAGRPAIKLAPETGLPWTVQAFSTNDEAGAFRSRRTLLLAGMAVLLLLILSGTWLIGHAVSRELAVARLQTDFVSTVSHEFRTPLTTLCQLSELLKRDRVAGEDDRRQYYELLYNESHRLRRLVEALLNFGRLEAGRLQFHFEPLDAAAFLRQSAAEFIEAQQTHGHRFEVETLEPAVVHADRETLRCVFWNLFENAVKYSPGCDAVWVNLSRNGTQVEIAVRDRGVGIPPNEHRRIFEKFVRGSSARDSNISGTGIGLAMARQIVRAHGGDIILESELGQGSTFRVVLPGT